MLFIKQAVPGLISLLHLSRRLAKWWIPKSHILKRVGKNYKRTSMKNLLKFRIKVFALIAILLLSVVGGLSAKKIAIIDAGSSGSRLYVYEIKDDTREFKVLYPAYFKGDALSKIDNSQTAVASFLTTMTSKYQDPEDEAIDLYVLATAGMRLVNGVTANEIYNMMRRTFLDGYELKGAMTISGQYEGLYAWIAANYKNGKLRWTGSGWSLDGTYGILEIGGASMQIAYTHSVYGASLDNCINHTKFGTIYSKSYLGGGVDQVFSKYDSNKAVDFGVNIEKLNLPMQSSIIFGLGRPIKSAIEGWRRTAYSFFEDYAKSLDISKDTDKNYHPATNARYIAHVIGKLELNINNIDISTESDWTEGAAIDIVINEMDPEPFNYSSANPN